MSRLLLAVVTAQQPSYYLQQLLNGIFSGSIYALFAVGYTLVFGVLDILNLAHSAVFTLGAVIALVLLTNFGLPFWLAGLLAIAVCGAIGYGLDLVAFRPLRHRSPPHISSMITSIALALIFVSLTENTFGANSRRFPPGVAPSGEIHIGAIGFDRLELLILALTLVLMLVLGYMIRSTRAGRAIRAVAENSRAAFLMGINVARTIALTLRIASALAVAD